MLNTVQIYFFQSFLVKVINELNLQIDTWTLKKYSLAVTLTWHAFSEIPNNQLTVSLTFNCSKKNMHMIFIIQDVGVFKTKFNYKKDGEGNNTKPHIS